MCDLRGGQWRNADADGAFETLAREIDDHDGPAIISEEMLGAATTEQATSAVERLSAAPVHVVVAVRDLARTLPSAWQQGVRARSVGRYETFLEGVRSGRNPGFWEHQFAVPVLQRWTVDVPPERRHVVVVPGAGRPRELLWERFAEAVGLDPARYAVGSPVGNPSLGAPEAELLRRLNLALGDEFPLNVPYGEVVRAHLTVPVLLANPSPARIALPHDAEDWVCARSHQLIEELRAFPCRTVGDIADLEPVLPAPEQTGAQSPDDVDTDALLELALGSMVGMLRHTDQRVGSWRRTAEKERRRADRLLRRLRQLEVDGAVGSGPSRGRWRSVRRTARVLRARVGA
jgi:hypothetical protein